MAIKISGTTVIDDSRNITNLGSALTVAQGGTGVTTSTGTGATVRSTSPALVTPALGTPSSGTLTNATGLPIVAGTTGTLSAARGGTGNTNGSAATLTTARTIGGVSFNGSANINLPGVNTAGNQNTTGSAATLTTARTIGGVSFNGSANINLPGVNAGGNQNTTGSAATLTTARAINGVNFNGSAAITLPTVNTSGDQTIAGTKTFSGRVRAVSYADTVVALGNTGTAKTINLLAGGVFTATLTGNCTFTITNPLASQGSSFTLVLTNDGSAGRTIAFAGSGASFRFPGGIAQQDRTTAANGVDIFVFFTPNGGTTYFGNIAMKDVKA